MNKGKLISFEGLDGCGKTTQAQYLVDQLNSLGINTIYLREPGGIVVCEELREVLLRNREGDDDLCSQTELLLFMASRMQLIEKVIKPTLAKGINVVLDRYIDSTLAYQGYACKNLELVYDTVKLFIKDLFPNKTFYLRTPIEFIERSLSNKDKDRMENKGIEYYTDVRAGFEGLSALYYKRIQCIDVTEKDVFRDKIDIHKEILKHTLDLLK